MSDAHGALHLLPVPLGDTPPGTVLPRSALNAIVELDYFIVENEKSARAFLASVPHPQPIRQLHLARFDKDGDSAGAAELLRPVIEGRSAGLLSEAGCPAIADPGGLLVQAAHERGIKVIPHIGPASMVLALMASGFNGQHFAFNGYLPVAKGECAREIEKLERDSRDQDRTHIFIETPYRSDSLLQTFLETCAGNTRLCVASDLTLTTESIRSDTIAKWKADRRPIGRRPSVFVLYAR